MRVFLLEICRYDDGLCQFPETPEFEVVGIFDEFETMILAIHAAVKHPKDVYRYAEFVVNKSDSERDVFVETGENYYKQQRLLAETAGQSKQS